MFFSMMCGCFRHNKFWVRFDCVSCLVQSLSMPIMYVCMYVLVLLRFQMVRWLSCKIGSRCLCCGQYQCFTVSLISFKYAILLGYYRANGFLEVILNLKSPIIFFFFFNFVMLFIKFSFKLILVINFIVVLWLGAWKTFSFSMYW